jgi:Galactosyltransferase
VKILIAVPSCHSLKHYEQSIRDTWGAEVHPGVDLRFFLGRREGIHDASLFIPSPDEVKLDVGDTLDDLTHKAVAMYSWSLAHGYEFVWKVDLDTLVRPKLLLSSLLEAYDWVGGQNQYFASGGGGYGLSKRAMQYVVDAGGAPGLEEDVYVARTLLGQGIELHNDQRFKFCPGDVMDDNTLTYHLSSIREWYYKKYRPEMMYEAWEDQKNRNYKSYAPQNSVQARVQNRRLRRSK